VKGTCSWFPLSRPHSPHRPTGPQNSRCIGWPTGPCDFDSLGARHTSMALVASTGTIATVTTTYAWNAVPSATYYQLWVNDSEATPKIRQWYTASEAGCASGTGTCTLIPGTALAAGQGGAGCRPGSPSVMGPGARR
jgi:hypothetical protein